MNWNEVSSTRYAYAVVKRMSKKLGCEDGVHVRIQLQACWGEDTQCDAEWDGCTCYLECPDCNYTEHGLEWGSNGGYGEALARQHRLQLGEGHDGWSAFSGCQSPECDDNQTPIYVSPDSPAFAIA